MNWRRVLLLSLFFVLVLVGVTWWVVTRSGFARDLVLGQLARLVSADVELEKAELDPLGGRVRLENLRVVPEEGGRKDALELPNVELGVSMNPLGSAGELRSVTIDGAELDVDLASDEPFDLEKLIPEEITSSRGAGAPLPSIRIRDLTVRLHVSAKPADGTGAATKDRILVLEPVELSLLPDRKKPGRMVLDGRCPNPFGGTVHIRGEAMESGDEFRLTAEAEEFRFDAKKIALLGEDVADVFRRFKLEGLIAPTLWLRYPDASGNVDAGVRGSFRDVQVEPPPVPYRFTHLAGRVQYRPGNGGALELNIERGGTDLQLDGQLALENLSQRTPSIRIRARAKDVALDRRLELALRELPPARLVYDAFQFRNGRGDVEVFVRLGPTSDNRAQDPYTQVDVKLRETELAFHGFPEADGSPGVAFPYAWKNASIDLKVRDEFVELPRIRADGVHGGTLEGHAQIDLSRDEAAIDIDVKGMPCSKELRTALASTTAEGPEIYDEFAPQGSFDVELRLRQPEGARAIRWTLGLEPRDASIEWKTFPYRVGNLAGRIDLDQESVRFHVAGRDGDAEIEGHGHVQLAEGGSQQIWVKAKTTPLDNRLRDALLGLDESFGESWELFSPQGKADVEFLGWRPDGAGELSYDIRADLLGVDARFEPFPVQLRDIRGPLVLHGDGRDTRVEVLGLTGRGLDALLSFEGTIDFKPNEAPRARLDGIAKGVRMRRELGSVLAETELVSPEIWKIAKVSGTVDAILEIRRGPKDEDWRQSLVVDLRSVESTAEILPDTLRNLRGSIRIDEDQVIRIEHLEGQIGEAPLMFEKGTIRADEDATLIDLEMSADRYPVDDRLANLLSGAVKKAYLDRHARGRVSLVGVGVRVRVPKVPPPNVEGLGLEIDFRGGEFRAHDLSLDMGVAVEDVSGFAVLDKGYVRPDASEIRGELGGLRFRALGQDFVDARGAFVATHERFWIPTGNVRIHGGILRGIDANAAEDSADPLLSYRFDDTRRLGLHFEVVDLDVAKATQGLELGQPYRGLVSGRMQIALDVDDPTTLDLHANLGVRDGWLGDAPIFRSIYGLLQQEKRPTFHAALLDVHSKGQSLEIRRLLLLSSLLRIEGKGQLDYDGYLQLQLEFPNLFPEASPLTLLPAVYRAVANALVRFDVSGYVGNLRSGPRFVPFERRPAKRQAEPVPGRRVAVPPIFRD